MPQSCHMWPIDSLSGAYIAMQYGWNFEQEKMTEYFTCLFVSKRHGQAHPSHAWFQTTETDRILFLSAAVRFQDSGGPALPIHLLFSFPLNWIPSSFLFETLSPQSSYIGGLYELPGRAWPPYAIWWIAGPEMSISGTSEFTTKPELTCQYWELIIFGGKGEAVPRAVPVYVVMSSDVAGIKYNIQ